jgi:dipeptidase E
MILYISSKQFGCKTDFLKNWITKNNNRILLIANALDAKDEMKIKNNIENDKKILNEIGFEVSVVDLKDYFNEQEKLLKDFALYNAYCVIGGNVFILRQAMKLSGFDNYLKSISKKDNYLYIGYSAGGCVLCNELQIFDKVDEPISFYLKDNVVYEGLGFIDYTFIPHYKSDYHKVHLIDDLVNRCIKEDIKFKALKDGEVIIEYVGKDNEV